MVMMTMFLAAAAAKHACDSPPPAYFLFTSTPDRADRLLTVLQSMRKQSVPPRKLVLTLARGYNASRFGSTTFALPTALPPRPQLEVHFIDEDQGPLSKYLGAVAVADPSAVVVVGDDDVFYGRTFIEDFACAVQASPVGTVLSNQLDADSACRWLGGCVMGFRGVAMRSGMLHGLRDFSPPAECFLADDVSISYFLSRVRGYRIRRHRLRTRHKLDNAFAWSNSSIHTFHSQRQFRVNEACSEAMRAKFAATSASSS